MRRERLYLTDIVEATDHIAAFIASTDYEGFQNSEMVRSAVVQKLAIIGEAAARVSEGMKSRHPEVPWPQIIAFRNISCPRIFRHRLEGSLPAARNRCPVLREQVAGILVAEFSGVED